MTEAQATEYIMLLKRQYVLFETAFGLGLAYAFWRLAWQWVVSPVLDLLHRRGILRTR